MVILLKNKGLYCLCRVDNGSRLAGKKRAGAGVSARARSVSSSEVYSTKGDRRAPEGAALNLMNSSSMHAVRHVLSVDVEDYFQVEAFAGSVSRDNWEQYPSRVVPNTERLLDLFDEHRTKATFFMVGWVAERFPALVREINRRGHELACHSFWHRTVYSLTPEEFRRDTRAAQQAIEQAVGVPVLGYRAPTWSITANCLWALDILAEEGF